MEIDEKCKRILNDTFWEDGRQTKCNTDHSFFE